ncbi:MAG: hypothetical protein U5P10_08480 [Spirochaetia bacterium]|nr:hypothetical protein [Spirochaetia bacterium]
MLLLTRYRQATLGVLVGLLLGAVVGLWPFQETVKPQPGYVYQGQELNSAQIEELSADEYPYRLFKPTAGQVGASLLLIGAGIAATSAISLIEKRSGEKKRIKWKNAAPSYLTCSFRVLSAEKRFSLLKISPALSGELSFNNTAHSWAAACIYPGGSAARAAWSCTEKTKPNLYHQVSCCAPHLIVPIVVIQQPF